MKKIWLLATVSLLTITLAFSQENATAGGCSNGKDDDGDGFIDCYDSDCLNVMPCGNSFIGPILACQAKPTKFPQFT